MALLILGVTTCPLCKNVIKDREEVECFDHFIEDPDDSYYKYSDACFHKECFEKWEMRGEYLKRYAEYEKRTRIPKSGRHGTR